MAEYGFTSQYRGAYGVTALGFDVSDQIGESPSLSDKIIHNEISLAALNFADEACLIC